jgi:hypothetical protein
MVAIATMIATMAMKITASISDISHMARAHSLSYCLTCDGG